MLETKIGVETVKRCSLEDLTRQAVPQPSRQPQRTAMRMQPPVPGRHPVPSMNMPRQPGYPPGYTGYPPGGYVNPNAATGYTGYPQGGYQFPRTGQ